MGAFLTYALDKDGVLTHVDDVLKGARCECFCPHCKAPLYAKNAGQIRMHHFAHAKGMECEYASETALHLLAKQIVSETGIVMLPKSEDASMPYGQVHLHEVKIEQYDSQYDLTPDAEGIMDNGQRLLIEFYVSHKVQGKKKDTIIKNNLKCIEIDLNYQEQNRDTLLDFLTNTTEDRKWIQESTPSKGESFSFRNPLYDKVCDQIKEQFDSDTLIISPQLPLYSSTATFDLKEYGYDVCERGAKYKGFKSGLLLYRSKAKDKGFISINVRGRRRYEGFRKPKDLRIIDILLRSSSEKSVEEYVKEGNICSDGGIEAVYIGFKNNSLSKKNSQTIKMLSL